MGNFKNRNFIRVVSLMIAAVILCCTQGFALNNRRAGGNEEGGAVRLQENAITVGFKLADGASDNFIYNGQPHGLELTAYNTETNETLNLKQNEDFVVSYTNQITNEQLDTGEVPVNAGNYIADWIDLPSGYEWDGITIELTIEPLANNYTVTGLNQSYVDKPNTFEVTVTFETPMVKDVDYTVRYYKQKDDGSFETNYTDPVKWDGTYRVSIQMNPGVSNYKLGKRTPADDPLLMVVKQRTYSLVTFYYNNETQNPFELEKATNERVTVSEAPTPIAQENLKFGGWYWDRDGDKMYSEGDTSFESTMVVGQDIDIVARWIASDDASLKSLSITDNSGGELELCKADYISPLYFDAGIYEYYLRVGVDTETVWLSAATNMSLAQISVENGGTEIAEKDDGYEIRLAEAVNASANRIKVTATAPDGEATIEYKVYIQRVTVPSLTLNYGNSPYGMIMGSELSDNEKTSAKAEFDKTLVYDGVKEGMRYGDEAWSSEAYKNYKGTGVAYNGDKDDTAIFIYQKQAFKDPGFMATDSLGRTVPHDTVKRSMRVISVSAGRPDYAAAGTPIPVNVQRESDIFTELENIIVRPGVYEMTYSFKDELTGETISALRKVIVVSEVGDVYIDGKVDSKDISTIEQEIYWLNITDSLYKFRIVDVCQDGNMVININDSGKIEQRALEPEAYPKYYSELK